MFGDLDYACSEFCGVGAVGGGAALNRFGYNTSGQTSVKGYGLAIGRNLWASEIGRSGVCGNAGSRAGLT